jgi:ketosteroid isomerase-like protein
MTEPSVEIVRAHIEAYREDDVERALAFLDPAIAMDVTRIRGVDGTVAVGHQEVIREVRRWQGTFEDYVFDVDRITDLGGGTVLVVTNERGSGKSSGAPVTRQMAGVYHVLDGRIVRITGFPSVDAALAAVGPEGDRSGRK